MAMVFFMQRHVGTRRMATGQNLPVAVA